MSETPKVYIACLASYNAGILHGEWIDLEDEDIAEQINAMLKASPIEDAEEWALHDHEYCGGYMSEYTGLDDLQKLSEAFNAVSQEGIEWEVFTEFCNHIGHEIEPERIETYQECYAGSADNLEDWCHDFLDETGVMDQIPENLRFYFDVARYARDMEINDVFTIEHNHQTHVFWHS